MACKIYNQMNDSLRTNNCIDLKRLKMEKDKEKEIYIFIVKMVRNLVIKSVQEKVWQVNNAINCKINNNLARK